MALTLRIWSVNPDRSVEDYQQNWLQLSYRAIQIAAITGIPRALCPFAISAGIHGMVPYNGYAFKIFVDQVCVVKLQERIQL